MSQCNLIVALGLGWLNQSILRYHSVDSLNKEYYNHQKWALCYSLIFSILFFTFLSYYQSLSNQLWLVSISIIIVVCVLF